jgi:hypothetical protein
MDRAELHSDDPSDGEWIDTTDDESESDDSWHSSDDDFIDDDWEVEPVVLNVNVNLRPRRESRPKRHPMRLRARPPA